MSKDKSVLSSIKNSMTLSMQDEQIRAIATTGRPRMIEATDEMNLFYSAFPDVGTTQTRVIHASRGLSYEGIKSILLDNSWELVRTHETYNVDEDKQFPNWACWMKKDGLMISMTIVSSKLLNRTSESVTVGQILSDIAEEKTSNGERAIEDMRFIFPMSMMDKIDKEWTILKQGIKENIIPQNTTPKLGIISHDGGDYYVKNFSMDGKIPSFNFPDLHYGDGFESFHDKLVQRISEESKGLILFHGEPGTGKTQYIRILLNKLGILGKSVLYVPPSFSMQLTDPGMIEFISDWIIGENRDCILLIEDAEPLLEIRNGSDGRTTGISNLLNMTDGLLNDMLGLMVIATFNTPITKIDPALLRAQRLVARKEFSKMSKEAAKKLSAALEIDLPKIEYPASLAEFYTANKEKNILLHTVDVQDKKIGF